MPTKSVLSTTQAISQKDAQENTAFTNPALDVGYQRLEFFLIGFASIFITFLWIGVFSMLLKDREMRVPFAGNGLFAATLRGGVDQVGMTVSGLLEAGAIVKDTTIYQFAVLWESSCLAQETCTGGVAMVAETFFGGVAIANSFSQHSHRVVALAQDISSFRLVEAEQSLSRLLSPSPVFASDVLGEKTVSIEALFHKSMSGYYRYVDFLTFGAVSAINPSLIIY